jgi:hypothetical protein
VSCQSQTSRSISVRANHSEEQKDLFGFAKKVILWVMWMGLFWCVVVLIAIWRNTPAENYGWHINELWHTWGESRDIGAFAFTQETWASCEIKAFMVV